MRGSHLLTFVAGILGALAAERAFAPRTAPLPAPTQHGGVEAVLSKLDEQRHLLDLLVDVSVRRPSLGESAEPGCQCPLASAAGPSASKDLQAAAVASAPVNAQPAEPESAQSKAALASAHNLLDGAIGHGKWTQEDRKRLQAIASDLSPEAEGELLQAYAAAINQRRIRPDRPGAPF